MIIQNVIMHYGKGWGNPACNEPSYGIHGPFFCGMRHKIVLPKLSTARTGSCSGKGRTAFMEGPGMHE